jgi:hypothetical protein
MMEREYFDSQGRSVSLVMLCRLEPEWASSRIETMATELDEVRESTRKLETENAALRELLRRIHADVLIGDIDAEIYDDLERAAIDAGKGKAREDSARGTRELPYQARVILVLANAGLANLPESLRRQIRADITKCRAAIDAGKGE